MIAMETYPLVGQAKLGAPGGRERCSSLRRVRRPPGLVPPESLHMAVKSKGTGQICGIVHGIVESFKKSQEPGKSAAARRKGRHSCLSLSNDRGAGFEQWRREGRNHIPFYFTSCIADREYEMCGGSEIAVDWQGSSERIAQ